MNFLTEKHGSEDYKIKYFYKRLHFTVIYTCYTWLERLLNSKHFCDRKSKQINNANLHVNRQLYIIYENMQIEITNCILVALAGT